MIFSTRRTMLPTVVSDGWAAVILLPSFRMISIRSPERGGHIKSSLRLLLFGIWYDYWQMNEHFFFFKYAHLLYMSRQVGVVLTSNSLLVVVVVPLVWSTAVNTTDSRFMDVHIFRPIYRYIDKHHTLKLYFTSRIKHTELNVQCGQGVYPRRYQPALLHRAWAVILRSKAVVSRAVSAEPRSGPAPVPPRFRSAKKASVLSERSVFLSAPGMVFCLLFHCEMSTK